MVEFRRFFVPSKNVGEKNVVITDEEHRHLSGVLRMRVGNRIIVCVGDGKDILCEIVSIDKSRTVLNIEKIYANESELKNKVTLFQAVIKGDKTEIAVQKAVELGVSSIVLFESEFTVAKCTGKEDRFNRIAMEAAKQCGRAILPSVYCSNFDGILHTLPTFDASFFCNEREQSNSLYNALSSMKSYNTMSVIVGSEGGFSEKEAEILSKAACSVTLGRRILRAETASICALSLISSFLDR